MINPKFLKIIEQNNETIDENQFDGGINGFRCFIRRHQSLYSLCSYVELPKNHVFYGRYYDEIDIDCHGGLTYSEFEDEKYVIGFDCAHYNDLTNNDVFNFAFDRATYKSINYVKSELENMTNQLIQKQLEYEKELQAPIIPKQIRIKLRKIEI